jgi:hypothetical protein
MKPRLSGKERLAADSALKMRACRAGYKVSFSFMTGRWRIFDAYNNPVIREGTSGFTFEEVAMFLLIQPVDPALPLGLKLPRNVAAAKIDQGEVAPELIAAWHNFPLQNAVRTIGRQRLSSQSTPTGSRSRCFASLVKVSAS